MLSILKACVIVKRLVGADAKYFKMEACVIVKQHVHVQHVRWTDIPIDIKRKMWMGMKV